MAVRVAINGFGRIGRCLTRLIADKKELELVAVNSRADTVRDVHMLRYDSVHGRFPGTVEARDETLYINGREVHITRILQPQNLPWKEMGVEVILESTGAFRDRPSNEGHLAAGAKKVIIGAPGKKIDATFVYGVNHLTYDPQVHHIVSNASCTTNCLAPVVKVLHENFGIRHGLMTTVHSYTMDQRLLDGSHEDLRRARAAALSMVPTSTGAAKAVTEVIPELKGRLDGLSVRVPTPNVSLVDFVAVLEKNTTKEEVNQALAAAQEGALKGILSLCAEPLVSIDFNGSTFSAVVDAALTNVMGGNLVKVMAWYDNEMGFSSRMLDLAAFIGQRLG
ncbi:MAG: type I glyceraldehyde-3-phosphate dehydrogenase [Deltaproteobacteria bacterium RBG_13_60_28]|nr:MAG: type I glyceraldehyde-3-phosphate dehydrogenase [Deltaproteobacteria bacterium RBG_13_60_28]